MFYANIVVKIAKAMGFLKLVISICRSTEYLVDRSKKRTFRNIASHSETFFITCLFSHSWSVRLKFSIPNFEFQKINSLPPEPQPWKWICPGSIFSFNYWKPDRLGVVWNIWYREIVKSVNLRFRISLGLAIERPRSWLFLYQFWIIYNVATQWFWVEDFRRQ